MKATLIDGETNMMNQNEKRRPAFKGKLDRVQIAIWENQSREGKLFYSVSFSRAFAKPDGKGETTWHQTNTFGEKDLDNLVQAVDLAKDWLTRQSPQKPEEVQVS